MLNPGYDLPSRKTLSTSYLPILYNETYDKVKCDILSNGKFVSITTDGWTSVQCTHLKSYLLSCFKYSDTHTSEHLKQNC